MIRSLLLTLLLFVGYESFAQTVSYSYKPLTTEGCQMTYSVTKQDTSYYIIATVKSDRLNFLNESTMLIKTFDGEIIKLSGNLIGGGSKSVGIVSGNMVLPITEISSTAQFSITEEQFEQLNKGVAKIRLSTVPIEHERTFKKDQIGEKLYDFYLNQRNKDDNF